MRILKHFWRFMLLNNLYFWLYRKVIGHPSKTEMMYVLFNADFNKIPSKIENILYLWIERDMDLYEVSAATGVSVHEIRKRISYIYEKYKNGEL